MTTTTEFNVLKKIGYLVRFHRRHKSLTQLQMSQMLDISHRSLQRLEIGEVEPKLDTLNNISKVLGISLTSLLRPTDESSLFLKSFATKDEYVDYVVQSQEATQQNKDLGFAQKLVAYDKLLKADTTTGLSARIAGSKVSVSTALGNLTGTGEVISDIDQHIAYGSSLERWELIFRMQIKQAVIQNYYYFPTGFKAFEEYHHCVSPNPENPVSELFIRDITHRYQLEQWLHNLKKQISNKC